MPHTRLTAQRSTGVVTRRLVGWSIGGRRLHLWAAGSGTPAVVIVTSLGAPGLEWARVQRALAQDTMVYVYDRAGLGWSDAGPCPRTVGRMADELHRLLDAAGVPAPFVLVGHSIGGLVARLYAARHLERLAGLVLVDSSHEDQFRHLRVVSNEATAAGLWSRALTRRLTPLGL